MEMTTLNVCSLIDKSSESSFSGGGMNDNRSAADSLNDPTFSRPSELRAITSMLTLLRSRRLLNSIGPVRPV